MNTQFGQIKEDPSTAPRGRTLIPRLDLLLQNDDVLQFREVRYELETADEVSQDEQRRLVELVKAGVRESNRRYHNGTLYDTCDDGEDTEGEEDRIQGGKGDGDDASRVADVGDGDDIGNGLSE